MHLRIVRVGEGLYVYVPILLVLCDIVSMSSGYGFVTPFGLPVLLWVVHCYRKMFHSREYANYYNELTRKLRIVVHEDLS